MHVTKRSARENEETRRKFLKERGMLYNLENQASKQGLVGDEWWFFVADGMLKAGYELHRDDAVKHANLKRIPQM